MVKPIVVATGTPENQWAAWPAPASWPTLELDPAMTPLVVAAHPDDEVLGVAGLMKLLGQADLVAVTDGEASHPDSTVHTAQELAQIRTAETMQALTRLGLRAALVHRLGQPDGRIDEDLLTNQLSKLLSPGRWCVATWRGDGHPDHEVVGRAAARACTRAGARLLEYPIWMWHWATPSADDIPWHRACRVELSTAAVTAKQAAIAAFSSQITALGPAEADAAVLPPHVLAHFSRPYETLFT